MIKHTALTVLAALTLTGCLHSVDMETGEGCWRYGVSEDNTGRMTRYADPTDIPVVRLGYEQLAAECGVELEPLSWHTRNRLQLRACYHPWQDKIYDYSLNFGEYFKIHERCHAVLGPKHNCLPAGTYAQWDKSEQAACNWNKEL